MPSLAIVILDCAAFTNLRRLSVHDFVGVNAVLVQKPAVKELDWNGSFSPGHRVVFWQEAVGTVMIVIEILERVRKFTISVGV